MCEAKTNFIITKIRIYILSSTELLSMREKRRRNRERGNHILHGSPSADLGLLVQKKKPKRYKKNQN